MKTNHLHQTVVTEDDYVDVLYRGQQLNHLVVDDTKWVKQYDDLCHLFEIPVNITWETESHATEEQYVQDCLADWGMPEEYYSLDLKPMLLNKCETFTQISRVEIEWAEFEKRNMIPVLQFLAYFVDTLTANNVIWGVGRGSSVASYILYLMGVHKVDALEYDLDIKEFLK